MNQDFETATAKEKTDALAGMQQYHDGAHPEHHAAVQLMAELCGAGPKEFKPDFSGIPRDVKELMKHPAITDRMHPRRNDVLAMFRKLHNVK